MNTNTLVRKLTVYIIIVREQILQVSLNDPVDQIGSEKLPEVCTYIYHR